MVISLKNFCFTLAFPRKSLGRGLLSRLFLWGSDLGEQEWRAGEREVGRHGQAIKGVLSNCWPLRARWAQSLGTVGGEETHRRCCRLFTQEMEEVGVIQWCVGPCVSQLGPVHISCQLCVRWHQVGGLKLTTEGVFPTRKLVNAPNQASFWQQAGC